MMFKFLIDHYKNYKLLSCNILGYVVQTTVQINPHFNPNNNNNLIFKI